VQKKGFAGDIEWTKEEHVRLAKAVEFHLKELGRIGMLGWNRIATVLQKRHLAGYFPIRTADACRSHWSTPGQMECFSWNQLQKAPWSHFELALVAAIVDEQKQQLELTKANMQESVHVKKFRRTASSLESLRRPSTGGSVLWKHVWIRFTDVTLDMDNIPYRTEISIRQAYTKNAALLQNEKLRE
jgi:hypothetical protein